ncbi:hypothetical protein OPQ81_002573 [Rhizoctonia solani]|nr:hypothetical protein OPQ81_002573 [Rhizoctonia solani]
MDSGVEGGYSSVPIDLANLAVNITFASSALAAAAEALAEAARAISDASGTFNEVRSTQAPTDPDFRNRVEAPSQLSESLDSKVPQTLNNAQNEPLNSPQFERPAGHFSPRDEASNNNKASAAFEPELNNKCDVFPPLVLQSSSMRESVPAAAPTNDPMSNYQSNMSRLSQVIEPPTIPPGHNYIQLDQHSDSLAFIAYMSLQFRKVVCLVSSHRQEIYAKLLKSLTHASIHCIDTPNQYNYVSTTLETPNLASYHILLTPCNNVLINWAWIQRSHPDCIIHWTQPANIYYCTTGRVVKSLPLTIRACVMVVGGESFDGKMQGVELYPPCVLNRCFRFNSTFQQLRRMSSELPAPIVAPSIPTAPKPPLNSQFSQTGPSTPRATNIPNNLNGSGGSLPNGHYYIVLGQANDIDTISMTAYIALNSKKMICHIPSDKDLTKYQNLINRVSKISITAPLLLKGKPFQEEIKSFKSQKSGIWLRTISSEWNSFWSKSLVDCVVYWGVPSDLAYYTKELFNLDLTRNKGFGDTRTFKLLLSLVLGHCYTI